MKKRYRNIFDGVPSYMRSPLQSMLNFPTFSPVRSLKAKSAIFCIVIAEPRTISFGPSPCKSIRLSIWVVVKNYGPFLGPDYNTAPKPLRVLKKGTLILTTTHFSNPSPKSLMHVRSGTGFSCAADCSSPWSITQRVHYGIRPQKSLLSLKPLCALNPRLLSPRLVWV